jgi:hypothetical protein
MRFVALAAGVAALAFGAAPSLAAPAVVTPVTVTILVGKHGTIGGPKTHTVHKGAHVVLRVKSPIGKEVHLHGYDIEKPITSKTAFVVMRFPATIKGVFEIELHITSSFAITIGHLKVT